MIARLGKLARTWFGDFSREELKKFLLLAFIFFFVIGVYWLIRATKDSVFATIIGADNIPWAKWVSLAVVVPLAMAYGWLVSKFPRHRVFYALSAIYGILGLLFVFLLQHPTIGLANTEVSGWRLLGWAYYVYVESFGSILVLLFWAFAADTTTPESAKRGYGIIAIGGQLGGIFGPLIVQTQAKSLGTAFVIGIGAVSMFMIGFMVRYFMAVVSKEQLTGYQGHETQDQKKKEAKVGFGEGLGLMLSQPYLLGIVSVIMIYEIISTIFDFYFKALAAQTISGDALTAYYGGYGVYVNILSFVCLIGGISNIARWLGLTVSLTLLPIVIAALVIVLNLGISLNITFWIMVFTKGLNYALNQPSKEQLYIPTTRETKYKAKAWVEMFGSRGSKAMGSGVNIVKGFVSPGIFMIFSSFASLGLCAVWFLVALYLGRTHKKAVENNKVVC
ncbi:MAG: Npt1/Npt2 family nucleotide transporter [Candidatus Babeliaceae bacterium]